MTVDLRKSQLVVMKFCHHCGSELKDSPKFCPNCGKSLGMTAAPAEDTQNISKANSSVPAPAEASVETTDKERGFFASIIHEKDPNKLLSTFLIVSLVDLALTIIYNLIDIIPNLDSSSSTPVSIIIGYLIIGALPYVGFRFWGIPKKTRIPFVIYLILISSLYLLMLADGQMVAEFELYLRHGPGGGYLVLISAYEHFVAGIGLEVLIAIKLLMTLDNAKSE